jgi:hypothetical protein
MEDDVAGKRGLALQDTKEHMELPQSSYLKLRRLITSQLTQQLSEALGFSY